MTLPGFTCHVPVLQNEVLAGLDLHPGQVVIDGTAGGGGHAEAIAGVLGSEGHLIAVDRDRHALARCEQRLAAVPGPRVNVVQANFDAIPEILEELNIPGVDGILLDLGLSSDQLADTKRGFRFDADGPLDLRFDDEEGEPAWKLLERLSPEHLADIFYRYGEERLSRRIARRIVEARRTEPVRTARQLSELVRRAVPRSSGPRRIHPATRTFQALRIAVNDELGSLERALARLPDCLVPGGRLAIISFHSLEDRRVKEAFRDDERWDVVTRRPVRPQPAEVENNPRSRSARLRVARTRLPETE